ncbi:MULTISPECIES: type II toxin-antitoxin system VapC family toxin [Tsukamurella]|uniref:Type II toxin-antitoxin system VapC family toxin n=2 Tax=Tsukamurella TaxID=2060 RepID=A0A5C5S000_9ACTN|nr:MULTISPECIES: type II toxin-antitoxin system VapC family toxin [Tsukamurella]NMD58083.1 type II toxin-antitoxin system VapC family toxin [Tsukamurella columbiensis]TWS28013.1 type II toxin-antitoxin system VapC family toxin [Tsukamurella conjunctivitidis]
MTQVADASVVASSLLNIDGDQEWADAALAAGAIVVRQLLQVGAANTIRRAVAHRAVPAEIGAAALADLIRLPIRESVPFIAIAERAWELRSTVTMCDAAYIAVAEMYDCRFATLDRRLARATGPRCEIITPPDR